MTFDNAIQMTPTKQLDRSDDSFHQKNNHGLVDNQVILHDTFFPRDVDQISRRGCR